MERQKRDELAALLRAIFPDSTVPDAGSIAEIARVVGPDPVLARFAVDTVAVLMAEHEDAHGKERTAHCQRCKGLEGIVRELENS